MDPGLTTPMEEVYVQDMYHYHQPKFTGSWSTTVNLQVPGLLSLFHLSQDKVSEGKIFIKNVLTNLGHVLLQVQRLLIRFC